MAGDCCVCVLESVRGTRYGVSNVRRISHFPLAVIPGVVTRQVPLPTTPRKKIVHQEIPAVALDLRASVQCVYASIDFSITISTFLLFKHRFRRAHSVSCVVYASIPSSGTWHCNIRHA